MNKVSRITTRFAIVIALFTLLSLVGSILGNLATGSFLKLWILPFSFSILVLVSLALGILVIIQTAEEKRANKPDENKPIVDTKGVTIRINVNDEPVVIEAPDAESAVEVFQGIHENIMKSENLLKAESHSEMKETHSPKTGIPDESPQRRDLPDLPTRFESTLREGATTAESQDATVDLPENEK